MSETLYPHEQVIKFLKRNGNGMSILSALFYAMSGAILLISYILNNTPCNYHAPYYFIIGILFIIAGFVFDYKSRCV
jgi:hypothetical protein